MTNRPERYIPPELEEAVLTHLLSNRLRSVNPAIRPNPILVVAGAAGTGKTTGIEAVCQKYRVPLYVVQGAALVAQLEGQATALLEDAILQAASDPSPFQAAVLVDDADLGGLSADPNITGTVNGAAAKGTIMGWADNPFQLKIEQNGDRAKIARLKRPPAMFMTTNRLDALHPPMIREGRATVAVLKPSSRQKTRIVASLFPFLGGKEAAQLARAFSDQSVAFFASLKVSASQKTLLACAGQVGWEFHNLDWERFNQAVVDQAQSVTLEELLELGGKMSGQSRTENFLKAKPSQPKRPNGRSYGQTQQATA